MRVGIIGLGFVGLTLAVVASKKMHDVFGIEINNTIKAKLRSKKAHFFEPGLDTLISRELDKKFHLVDGFEKSQQIDIFVVTVGTPLHVNSNIPNYDYIKSALNQIKDVYTGNELIILRSTVSVGTTRNVVIPFLSKISGKTEESILVAFCPERTVEGDAVKELQELPQIIGANNEEAKNIAETFFRQITPTILIADSLELAELIKLFNNTYRDVHFAIGNMFNEVAQLYGINGVEAIEIANSSYLRSKIARPGFVGGPCLEKDAYILTNNLPPSKGRDFIVSARKYNESLEDKVIKWVKSNDKANRPIKKICISGLAFKGVPSTSDLRGSNGINIAKKLYDLGYELSLHDFFAIPSEVKNLNLGNFSDNLYEAAKNCSCLLVLNNSNHYLSIEAEKLDSIMLKKYVILDAWGVLDYFQYDDFYTLGNIEIHKK